MYTQIHTAIGPLGVARSEKGLCAIRLDGNAAALKQELARRFPGAELVRDQAGLAGMAALVTRWLAEPAPGPLPPLDLGGTDFQRRVWRAIARVPRGEVISYTELARRAGNPRAVRAAAQACGANPVPLLVPCHRVVRSDGSLGGFGGGLPMKRKLLSREGVDIA
ncbi:methylated-DNA--[protein]-cysteine S-methyltransferase [Thioalkalivibrio sp. XN8]|uniref:methylated-DNA--[protein]-cysteine S-methyltransferase n=1 Tax=Thioalkalivibrio sp. XN8 TaxID=2712863 RepID=UPI0013EBF22C|nr:methylated-DNA--[protein]-cysteine S-methyltransferase [Thioalkalivibrio sp. XN8]NGP53505.1 methylated-DNA--[protein]-cysteine S-methyltransferase [Thioalkalivibrio sp. XN8]